MPLSPADIVALAQRRLLEQTVFYFHPTRAWEIARVTNVFCVDTKNGEEQELMVTVRAKNGDCLDMPLRDDVVFKPSQNSVDNKPNNLLSLPELHDSVLLNVLRLRYQDDMIYTSLGDMVVSINPLKSIPWYADSNMQKYLEYVDSAALPEHLLPHLWSVSHRAFNEMHSKRINYSIITSGESGSGKTEACKIMLRYLCAASTATCRDERVSAKVAKISESVLLSNIVLEAFGNAKTIKNDNSSRFGKFMEVQFNASGALVGMRITPFLLERSRVVTCNVDERVYHVFYQLVAGARGPLKEKLRIGQFRDFALLHRGKAVPSSAQTAEDSREFEALGNALRSLGFSDSNLDVVWGSVAAILHLQNIEFEERRVDNAAFLTPEGISCAEFVAKELLFLPRPDRFVECLTKSVTYIGSETLTRNLSLRRAKDQLDSICKFVYSKLFLYIVQRINVFSTSFGSAAEGENAAENVAVNWVALLDIFGFEDFPNNSFEQFCINLANEALQRHFSQAMFVLDSEELRSEGVDPEIIQFQDNQPCLALMQGGRNSIISFLDDASTLDMERAQTNPDYVFLGKLTNAHKPDYQTASTKQSRSVLDRTDQLRTPSDFFLRGRLDDHTFTIRHYAGDIRYNVNGFVEKNMDMMRDSSAQVLMSTTNETVLAMFSTQEEQVGLLGDDGSVSSPMSPRGGASFAGADGGGSAYMVKRTVASTFRNSLRMLMEMLSSSMCNWVRCLRPHSRSIPGMFDGKLIMEQLVATGVLSTIAQRQKNFPFRIPMFEFARDFAVSCPAELRGIPIDAHEERCRAILAAAHVGKDMVQLGRTRVFVRGDGMLLLDERVTTQSQKFASTLNIFMRSHASSAYVARRLFHMKAIRIQRAARTMIRIKRCIHQYAAEVARRRRERFLQAEKDILRSEGLRRNEIVSDMGSFWRTTWKAFRAQLVPLVSAVLDNVRKVETTRRTEIANEERATMERLRMLAAQEAAAAKQRQEERIRAMHRRHALERDSCVKEALAAMEQVRSIEAGARAALMRDIILPGVRRLEQQAMRIKELNKCRDERVAVLQREYEMEVQRLQLEEAQRVEAEAQLWKSLVGEEQFHKDVMYFLRHAAPQHGTSTQSATRRYDAASQQNKDILPQMRIFFREGIPSAVAGSAPLSRQSYEQTSSSGSNAGLGAVESFAAFQSYMRRKYEDARKEAAAAGGGGGRGKHRRRHDAIDSGGLWAQQFLHGVHSDDHNVDTCPVCNISTGGNGRNSSGSRGAGNKPQSNRRGYQTSSSRMGAEYADPYANAHRGGTRDYAWTGATEDMFYNPLSRHDHLEGEDTDSAAANNNEDDDDYDELLELARIRGGDV